MADTADAEFSSRKDARQEPQRERSFERSPSQAIAGTSRPASGCRRSPTSMQPKVELYSPESGAPRRPSILVTEERRSNDPEHALRRIWRQQRHISWDPPTTHHFVGVGPVSPNESVSPKGTISPSSDAGSKVYLPSRLPITPTRVPMTLTVGICAFTLFLVLTMSLWASSVLTESAHTLRGLHEATTRNPAAWERPLAETSLPMSPNSSTVRGKPLLTSVAGNETLAVGNEAGLYESYKGAPREAENATDFSVEISNHSMDESVASDGHNRL